MPATPHPIERLTPPVRDADVRALAALLIDAVESGAAVSFLAPLAPARAEEWWRKALECSSGPIVLVARDGEGIAGTVSLQPAWAPNQPHRAEVVKLLVHRRARGGGLGALLMRAIEQAGCEAGFRLLTLDARAGGVAHHLYQRLGWTEVGTIPRYAVDTDGRTMHDAVFFYKEIAGR